MSKANFHEFLIPRGRLFKKGLAVFSSAAIALTAVCGSLSLAAEDETASAAQTAEFAEETVLFESDYGNVTDWSAYDDETKNDASWCTKISGNLFPKKETDNGCLIYTQSSMAFGLLRLGHTYNKTDFDYNYVRVEAGKTYTIEFDMRLKASNYAKHM